MTSAIAAWLMTYAVHSTLLFVAAAFISKFTRRDAVRDVVWRTALVGALVTSSLQLALPPLRRFELQTPRTVPAQSTVLESARMQRPTVESIMTTAPITTPATPIRRDIDWSMLAVAIWGTLSLSLLARFALIRRYVYAGFGVRREHTDGHDLALLARLRERAGWNGAIRLTRSSTLASPVAVHHSEICLPEAMLSTLSEEQKETIFAHELAHVTRQDPLWLTISEVIKAVFFFQPLTWVAQREMRLAAEYLCDDFALLNTGNARALAECLAELATRIETSRVPVAAMAEGRSRLIERVSRVLLDGRIPECALSSSRRSLLVVPMLAVIVFLAPSIRAAAPHAAAIGGATETSPAKESTLAASPASIEKDRGVASAPVTRSSSAAKVQPPTPSRPAAPSRATRKAQVQTGKTGAWRGNTELIGSHGGEYFRVRVAGANVVFSKSNPALIERILEGGWIDLEEDYGYRRRKAHIDGADGETRITYSGDWQYASELEKRLWLDHLLRDRTDRSPKPFR